MNRATPTNPHYSSDSNSNSNQSPPTPAATSRLRTDCETQTDFDVSFIEGSEVFVVCLRNAGAFLKEVTPAPPEEIAKRDRLIQELKSQLIEEQNRVSPV